MSGTHDHLDPSHIHSAEAGDPTGASVDNLAGTVAANGKPIWSAQQAADHLFRADAGFGTGGNRTMPSSGDINEIRYGFHTGKASLADNGYVYEYGGRYYGLNEYFYFAPFTAAQQAAAREAMQYWDDVMAPSFVESHIDDADIAFGNYTNRPGTQAYARLTADVVSSNPYVNEQIREIGGDVWVAANTVSNFHLDEGGYGMNTLVHEVGHGFGMLHPGDYNFTPGGPPLSYATHAEYYQDTRNYSVLSYWNPRDIGLRDYDWTRMNIAYGATPMVHDILSVQSMYGADTTTRTGDTTYGFNSNADRDAFDFVKTPAPMMAIWDAGGNDTLDASGYGTDQVIDLNPGSLSSIGGITLAEFPTFDEVNANRAAAGMAPVAQSLYDANKAVFLRNPDFYGRLQNNVGIAYGAIIENAVGGSGDDILIANSARNELTGGEGFDIVSYRSATAGVQAQLTGGGRGDGSNGDAKNDRYVSVEGLEGSEFADQLQGDNGDDLLSGLGGDDRIDSGAGDDSILGGAGNDRITANDGEDLLDGGDGADFLDGENGVDILIGDGGDDTLQGGNGSDRLDGGAGDDRVLGGNGADTFVASLGRDIFVDFKGGEDKIDFSGLLAGAELDAFTLVEDEFTGAGQIRIYQENGDTILAGDLDGDFVADFFINLGDARVNEGDFLLS